MFNLLDKNQGVDFLMKEGGVYSFVNPYSYVLLRRYSRICYIDVVFVDGSAAVSAFRILGFSVKRKSFDMTSLAPQVFQWCIDNDKNIAFIGSKKTEVEKATESFKTAFPGLDVSYHHHGYLPKRSEARKNVLAELLYINPDVVVVGMGTPTQEDFLIDLKQAGWSGTGFTCGGFLHQTASAGLEYYPKFFNKYNLRWLYRMYDEPKLIKRYFFEYPKFIFYIIYDFSLYRKELKSKL